MELKGQFCKDCKIFTDQVEEEAISTVYSIINHPVFKDTKIRCMPDIHQGKGIVIGFTCELGNFVNPSHVGCDIGCSITSTFYNINVEEKDYKRLESLVQKAIPNGFNLQPKRIFDMKEFYKFMNTEMSKARSSWPEMVYDIKVGEKYVTNMLRRIGMDEGIFYKSIGTTGGGNHFLEMGEKDREDKNAVWTIHCGSRNFGLKVFKYWDKVSKNESKYIDLTAEIEQLKKDLISKNEKYKINSEIKKLRENASHRYPKGYLFDENMRGYLTDVFFCQAYAKFNHYIISKEIEKCMKKIDNKAKIINTIQSIHNYINPKDHIIRKGAITAYEGEKIIIPFNMRDGLAICEGKSNPDWNFSAPHGAGRIMSRSKAKENISIQDFKESMKNIYTTSVGKGTLDESPMAYKNMEDIIDKIGDTCEILYFIKPKINIKASDSSED